MPKILKRHKKTEVKPKKVKKEMSRKRLSSDWSLIQWLTIQSWVKVVNIDRTQIRAVLNGDYPNSGDEMMELIGRLGTDFKKKQFGLSQWIEFSRQ